MLLLQVERFAINPDWLRVSERQLNRAQELVCLIQPQCYLTRAWKSDEYYGWILELKKILEY